MNFITFAERDEEYSILKTIFWPSFFLVLSIGFLIGLLLNPYLSSIFKNYILYIGEKQFFTFRPILVLVGIFISSSTIFYGYAYYFTRKDTAKNKLELLFNLQFFITYFLLITILLYSIEVRNFTDYVVVYIIFIMTFLTLAIAEFLYGRYFRYITHPKISLIFKVVIAFITFFVSLFIFANTFLLFYNGQKYIGYRTRHGTIFGLSFILLLIPLVYSNNYMDCKTSKRDYYATMEIVLYNFVLFLVSLVSYIIIGGT